jgi:hypothetical protein
MTCPEVRSQLSALLDGALALAEREAAERHVAACGECRRELDGLRATAALLRGLGPARAPAGFAERVLRAAAPRPWTRRVRDALFVPLRLKLPLEAVAVALVAVGAVYLVQRPPGVPAPTRDERAATNAPAAPAPRVAPAPPSPAAPGPADAVAPPASPEPAAPSPSTEPSRLAARQPVAPRDRAMAEKSAAGDAAEPGGAPRRPDEAWRYAPSVPAPGGTPPGHVAKEGSAPAPRQAAPGPGLAAPRPLPGAGSAPPPEQAPGSAAGGGGAPGAVEPRARLETGPTGAMRPGGALREGGGTPPDAARPGGLARVQAVDASGRLTVVAAPEAERALGLLLQRLGGRSVARRVEGGGALVVLEFRVPRARYPELTSGLARIGQWSLEHERVALPSDVRVEVAIATAP